MLQGLLVLPLTPTVCAPPADATVPPAALFAAVLLSTFRLNRTVTLLVPAHGDCAAPTQATRPTIPPTVVPPTDTVTEVPLTAVALVTAVPLAPPPVNEMEPPSARAEGCAALIELDPVTTLVA
jgi:hypothetical protein